MKFVSKILSFLVFSLFVVSCNVGNDENETKQTMKVSDYAKAGQIHNSFLNNIKNNFSVDRRIRSRATSIDFVNEFNKKFVETLDISTKDKEIFKRELDRTKSYINSVELTERAFRKSPESNKIKLVGLIDDLKRDGVFSQNSYDLVNKLIVNLKSNYENKLSNKDFKKVINNIILDFDNSNYSVDSKEGELVATILSISISSVEWWEQNPDAFNDKEGISTYGLPVWAGADIAGAIYGGVTGATSSKFAGGSVSWKAIGVSAVAGSTGVVGKWISKLL